MLEEDAPEMLRNAQERMGKKLKAELLSAAAASADAATAEATEAADQMAPSLGILEEDGASSAQPTSRSTLSKSKVIRSISVSENSNKFIKCSYLDYIYNYSTIKYNA